MLGRAGLAVDASCVWRWVQTYAPELNKRCRPHLPPTNKSYRIDETYIRIKGEDRYLYRAVDSTAQTIEFLLTAKRDAAAAKRFLVKAKEASGNAMPRVMNVDKNPAYPAAVQALKRGTLPRRLLAAPMQVSEECNRAGSQSCEETGVARQRLWLVSECVAYFAKHRNSPHDSERKGEMAGQR
jgi:transposase-like protein